MHEVQKGNVFCCTLGTGKAQSGKANVWVTLAAFTLREVS